MKGVRIKLTQNSGRGSLGFQWWEKRVNVTEFITFGNICENVRGNVLISQCKNAPFQVTLPRSKSYLGKEQRYYQLNVLKVSK